MRDESYAAGYRAGHFQGWMDAIAEIDRMRQETAVEQPAPERVNPAQAVIEQPILPPAPARPAFAPAAPARQPVPAPAARTSQADAGASGNVVGLAREVRPRPSAPVASSVRAAAPSATPAERQARRERRDRQNINITLYVASLLLVAAAALFVGSSLPPMLRLPVSEPLPQCSTAWASVCIRRSPA